MANKFVISIPMVAKTFKTTYNKQLEVYVYDNEVIQTFSIKKDEIVEIFPKKMKWIYLLRPEQYRKGIPIDEDVIGYNGTTERYMYFDNLELAMASKVYLLRELKRTYKLEIQKLEVRLAKNMPKGLEKQFENLEKNYAEYFI